jgi:hypothetical protein
MTTKMKMLVLSTLFAFFCGGGWALAQHQHGHGTPPASADKKAASQTTPPSKSNSQSIMVEGMKITFEVMSMEEHMQHLKTTQGHGQGDHSQTHSFMVTMQDIASKEILSDAKVQFTISSPQGGKETGKLTWSGDYYGGGFSPKDKGTYQIQLKIESNGMEREANFSYELK